MACQYFDLRSVRECVHDAQVQFTAARVGNCRGDSLGEEMLEL